MPTFIRNLSMIASEENLRCFTPRYALKQSGDRLNHARVALRSDLARESDRIEDGDPHQGWLRDQLQANKTGW